MTRPSRRHSSSLQTTFKDYIVPIIGGVLLILLMYSFFNGSDETPTINTSENKNPISITFGTPDTEAYIVYPKDVKEKMSESSLLYKDQSVIVTQGTLKLLTPDSTSIHLNKTAQLKLNLDGSYELYSSDAWFELTSAAKIALRYATLESPAGSVLSLTQNEAGSTIYVLAGSAKISNLAGIHTSLVKGQKISVPARDAHSQDIDLSGEKLSIDSYFKGSNWFIDNKGYTILEKDAGLDTEEKNNSGSIETGTLTGTYIIFENFKDEMSIDTKTITISGKILSTQVGSISFNNKSASLNIPQNTFRIENLPLGSTMNDIVVKIYDTEKNILEKNVYTVYTSQTSPNVESPEKPSVIPVKEESSQISNTLIDPSDFGFSEPSSSGKFSTSSSEITLRGYTNAKGISAVQVNGFPLASFNGNTWRYHAFERFETLKEGNNQYKVDYLGADGKIVYSDYFSIVKKAAGTIATPTSSSSGGVTSSTPVKEESSSENSLFQE